MCGHSMRSASGIWISATIAVTASAARSTQRLSSQAQMPLATRITQTRAEKEQKLPGQRIEEPAIARRETVQRDRPDLHREIEHRGWQQHEPAIARQPHQRQRKPRQQQHIDGQDVEIGRLIAQQQRVNDRRIGLRDERVQAGNALDRCHGPCPPMASETSAIRRRRAGSARHREPRRGARPSSCGDEHALGLRHAAIDHRGDEAREEEEQLGRVGEGIGPQREQREPGCLARGRQR